MTDIAYVPHTIRDCPRAIQEPAKGKIGSAIWHALNHASFSMGDGVTLVINVVDKGSDILIHGTAQGGEITSPAEFAETIDLSTGCGYCATIASRNDGRVTVRESAING